MYSYIYIYTFSNFNTSMLHAASNVERMNGRTDHGWYFLNIYNSKYLINYVFFFLNKIVRSSY